MAASHDLVEPACIIVTGMPGAGKSTVSELLASRLPRAARLSGDVVSAMVRGGHVWALGSPPDEAAAQVELTHRNLSALANNMTSAGFTAVIDVLLETPAQLASLTGSLTCSWALVVLAPGAEVCAQRNNQRDIDERWDFDDYAALDAKIWASFEHIGWWLDTATLTAAESAKAILRWAYPSQRDAQRASGQPV